jgi:titin
MLITKTDCLAMRKNYFLSLFLLLTAFWHVQAQTAPDGLSGTPVSGVGTRINLIWNDNIPVGSGNEDEFEIAYSTLPTGYQSILTGSPGTVSVNTFQLTNLQPATTYYIFVRAIGVGGGIPSCSYPTGTGFNPPADDANNSCWSNGIIVTTNDNIPAPVTGASVGTPYSQRSNTLYFTDNSNNETEFIIERKTGGDFSVIARIPGVDGTGQRSFVDNSTLPNTFYSYRVTSSNATGKGFPESTTAPFRTLQDPPLSPSGLATYSIGLRTIGIYWNNPAPNTAADFLIQQSTDKNNWVNISTTPSNIRNLVVQNLKEGQRYFFRVIARNEGGSSNSSNLLEASTENLIAPNPSANMFAKTISKTQIDLTWNLGTYRTLQDGITNKRVSQEVYRSDLSATDGFIKIATIGENDDKYSDKTGMPKTKYWYKILSANYQGQSPFSNVSAATTLGPPYAPTNLTTVLASDALGNNAIKVTWKDNSDDEWGFALERSTDSTFAKGVVKADLDSNTIAATSIPIEEGLTYFFRVNASNIHGVSKYSATSKIEVAVSAAPNAPYDLKGTATSAEVSLKWGDDSNKETAFDVERSIDGTTFSKIGSTGRNEVTYSDKTVSEKTKYSYRVRATNSKGNYV